MENWKAVVGYDGLYEVSDLGRVRSLPRLTATGMRGGKLLKPRLNTAGYLRVNLSDGVTKHQPSNVHQLVALAFPAGDGPQVRHLDGNKLNNRADNLRYGTSKEDYQDRVKHGVRYDTTGERNGQAKLTEIDVVAIKHGLQLGVKQVVLAPYFGVSFQTISEIHRGLSWQGV